MSAYLFAGEWAASGAIGAQALADDARRPDYQYIQCRLGVLEAVRGDLDGARARLDAAGDLAERDDIEARHDHATLAGLIALAEDDLPGGLELLATTSREAVAGQGASSENLRLAWPAAVGAAVALGRADEARSLIDLVAAMPAGTLSPLLRAELDRARGLIAAAAGDPEAAQRDLGAAVDAFAELDYPFWVARTTADLASVLIDAGRGAEAALRLESVLEPLVELGAEPELGRVRALLERAITAEAR
jgi:hypothetical protein